MEFIPDKCRVPELLRERHIEPVEFYTDPRINWSKQQYYAYASGRRKMSASQMKKCGHYFGLPMDDIYTWKIVPSRRKSKGTGKNENRN